MLQAAITAFGEVQHKQVVVGRRSLHAHQPAAGQANLFEIAEQLGITVEQVAALQIAAPTHPAVVHTGDAEVMGAMGTNLNRRIDKLVEIDGKPALRRARQLWQGHEGIPAGRKAELQPVG